jgi:hypothetical protein
MGLLKPLRLAAIAYDRGFDIDRLLTAACERLSRRGARLGGLLQVSTGGKGSCASSVQVIDLRTNATFDIWEARGTCASGCRLDERGLAAASNAIDRAIADRVDLVIMNRFGRAESLGGGLLASFSSAASEGVPALTAVRPPYDVDWENFHGGLGLELPADVEAIVAWAELAVGGYECVTAAAAR